MVDLSDLTLTFDSNFNDFTSSPNGSVGWQTTLPHHLRTLASNNEQEYYSDPSVGVDPFSVQNGVLTITAAPGSNPDNLPYNSGIITTEGEFSQTYGYFEMSAELPAGQGMWPAFWLLPQSLSGPNEIDVMEMYGTSGPDTYYATDHSLGSGTVQAVVNTTNLTDSFNTYGVYWTPTSTSFYVNGTMVANMPTPADMDKPMFMLANLAVSSNVTAATPFPETMAIQYIRAYAYNPNDPGPTPQLAVTAPTGVSGTTSQPIALGGVSIADSDTIGAGSLSVIVSDKSLGLLSTIAVTGVTAVGEDSWHLQLIGSLSAVNAALATLTYENVPTSATAPTADTVTVAATDADNNMDAERISVALGPGPALQFISVSAQPERYLATGNDVFVLTNGELANPLTNGGQADHIINFQSIAQPGSPADFLALYGFGPTATLVFDHNADLNGAPDPSMQYYHVATATGNSPIFMVQMPAGDTAHLTSQNYGFYPT